MRSENFTILVTVDDLKSKIKRLEQFHREDQYKGQLFTSNADRKSFTSYILPKPITAWTTTTWELPRLPFRA